MEKINKNKYISVEWPDEDEEELDRRRYRNKKLNKKKIKFNKKSVNNALF